MTEATSPATEAAASPAPAATEAAALPLASSSSDAAAAPSATTDAASSSISTPPESTPSLLSAADGKPKAEIVPEPKASQDKPAPAEEAKPAEAKVETKDAPKEPPKAAAEAPATDDASKAPDPAKAADAALQPPVTATIEDLNLPAEIKFGEKEGKAFLDLVNDPKLDAKTRAKGLTEMYLAEAKRLSEAAVQHQMDVWLKYNEKEKADFRADPEVGGNRADTTLTLSKAYLERYMPPERLERFLKVLDYTGLGNNRDMIFLLNESARMLRMDKAEDGMVAAQAKPPNPPKGPGNRGWYQDMPDRARGAA